MNTKSEVFNQTSLFFTKLHRSIDKSVILSIFINKGGLVIDKEFS